MSAMSDDFGVGDIADLVGAAFGEEGGEDDALNENMDFLKRAFVNEKVRAPRLRRFCPHLVYYADGARVASL